MDNDNLNKLIDERIRKQLQGNLFTARKITDTPTDDLMVVNRKYTNLNGTVATRPTSSVATVGQRYFATDTNIPMTYSSGGWRNGVGSVVAAI
jgi:hypothetical protein